MKKIEKRVLKLRIKIKIQNLISDQPKPTLKIKMNILKNYSAKLKLELYQKMRQQQMIRFNINQFNKQELELQT